MHPAKDATAPGDALRNHAAELLAARHGQITVEHRDHGKKVDLFFTREDLGRRVRVYVEAKDWSRVLGRDDVKDIWADYDGIVDAKAGSILLIVTRQGLTADADAYVNHEKRPIRHQTIWELEDGVLGLSEYVRSLEDLFDEEGLSSYYINAQATRVAYVGQSQRRVPQQGGVDLFDTVQEWIAGPSSKPLAILGGYGAGKSSFAKKIVSHQAKLRRADPSARQPILIRLGVFTGYSSLAGVLGGMFTHDFPVESFNAHRFLELNRRGRLLVVLDGFDEMKHAMTFADFRSQLAELNKLVAGDARVLLLGRPNAFISEEEHVHVLRGRARYGRGAWRRLTDWPEFLEYDLRAFEPHERSEFIRGYLVNAMESSDRQVDPKWIGNRIVQIQEIAASVPDVFNKPVHNKILTELGSDPDVDLSSLEGAVSRWHLYETFFTALAAREVGDKPARRPITEEPRLKFLGEVAWWLWKDRVGHISFNGFDLPNSILDKLPDGDSSELEGKKREYLTGSFLEKKGGDVFYFPHRSFAEFLVAQQIGKSPPQGKGHTLCSRLVKDGVADFLLDSPYLPAIRRTVGSLHLAGGALDLTYLEFLRRAHGTKKLLLRAIEPRMVWREFLDLFEERIGVEFVDVDRLWKAIRRTSTELLPQDTLSPLAVQLAFPALFRRSRARSEMQNEAAASAILGAVLDRLFSNVRSDLRFDFFLTADGAAGRDMAEAAIGERSGFDETLAFPFHPERLRSYCETTLRQAGINMIVGAGVEQASSMLGANVVFRHMAAENVQRAKDYFRRHRGFRGFRTR